MAGVGPALPPGPAAPGPAASGDDTFGAAEVPAPLVLRCRIVMLGEATVGKTSIAQVFRGGVGTYPKNYTMTIGVDFSVKKVNIPETNVVVELYIVDCGGFSQVCDDLLKPHLEHANVVMLIYDLSSPETFDKLAMWYDMFAELITQSRSHISGVVIANKTDLADRPGAVPSEKGEEFSRSKGLEFFETCAATGQVEAPFNFR